MTTQPKRLPYRERPLAPAPLPALVGVSLLVLILLVGASKIVNDWLAVAGCVAAIALGAFALDYTGRVEAEKHPNRLYTPQRLPSEKSRLKPIAIVVTLVILLVITMSTVTPTSNPSPFPYFVAAAFLYLVLPQMLARQVVRKSSIAPEK